MRNRRKIIILIAVAFALLAILAVMAQQDVGLFGTAADKEGGKRGDFSLDSETTGDDLIVDQNTTVSDADGNPLHEFFWWFQE